MPVSLDHGFDAIRGQKLSPLREIAAACIALPITAVLGQIVYKHNKRASPSA